MPTKGSGSTELREIDRFDGGVGWIAYPEEDMQRASHALVGDDGGLWVIDPVDADDLDELLGEFGEVSGVVLLLERHKRDAGEIARRHDVPVYVPHFLDVTGGDVSAPVETFRLDLADSGFGVYELDHRIWSEGILYEEDDGTLVVPEAVGTASFFRVGDERLGVHPALRLTPPRRLTRFDPERVLVGHGEGVHEDTTAAIQEAISGSRRRAPRAFIEMGRDMLFG